MIRRQLFHVLRQELRSSSTSSGLRGQHQPGKVPVLHQYPKIDPMTLVGHDLSQMVGEIHQELDDELKSDIELGQMAQ